MSVVDISLFIDVNLLFISYSHILWKRWSSDSRIFSLCQIIKLVFPRQVWFIRWSEVIYVCVILIFVSCENRQVVDFIVSEIGLITKVLFENERWVIVDNVCKLIIDRIHVNELALSLGLLQPWNLSCMERQMLVKESNFNFGISDKNIFKNIDSFKN